MLKKFLIIAGLIATSNAFAQADKFSGFSIGFNTGFESSRSVSTSTTDSTTIGVGATNTPFDINFAYVMPLSSNTTIGLGATYDLSSPSIFKDSEFTANDDITTDGKLNDHYSIYIEPGYTFNDTTLGYFKLGYHSGKIKIETVSNSVTGTGYGFGMRHLIDKNIYLNVGVEKITYKSTTFSDFGSAIQLTQTLATVGIGYKF